MMMPACPGANLIIRKPGLALGPLETVLYAMLGLDHSGQFFHRSIGRGIRKIVIIFHWAVFLGRSRSYQKFFYRLMPTPLGSSNHPTSNYLDHQRAFLTISNLNFCPDLISQRISPSINSLKRLSGRLALSRISRWFAFKVAEAGIGWNRQKVLFAQSPQIPAKTAGTAHFVIPGYPAMRQILAVIFKHLQSQFLTGLIANMFRYAAFFATNSIFAPLFGKIQTLIHQGMFFTRSVTHIDTHLAVVDFAQPTQPLPLDTHRITTTLLMPRRVKDNDSLILANFLTNLPGQLLLQGLMVPGAGAYELLKRPAILIVAVGNGLNILSLQIRQQAAHIHLGIVFWLASAKSNYKRLGKLFQALQHALGHLGLDISFLENFTFSQLESSLHDSSFPLGPFPWKVIRINGLQTF